jgi:hypothetical protein
LRVFISNFTFFSLYVSIWLFFFYFSKTHYLLVSILYIIAYGSVFNEGCMRSLPENTNIYGVSMVVSVGLSYWGWDHPSSWFHEWMKSGHFSHDVMRLDHILIMGFSWSLFEQEENPWYKVMLLWLFECRSLSFLLGLCWQGWWEP